MYIPVHSPWLPGYMDVVQTILITMAGLFLDRPSYNPWPRSWHALLSLIFHWLYLGANGTGKFSPWLGRYFLSKSGYYRKDEQNLADRYNFWYNSFEMVWQAEIFKFYSFSLQTIFWPLPGDREAKQNTVAQNFCPVGPGREKLELRASKTPGLKGSSFQNKGTCREVSPTFCVESALQAFTDSHPVKGWCVTLRKHPESSSKRLNFKAGNTVIRWDLGEFLAHQREMAQAQEEEEPGGTVF